MRAFGDSNPINLQTTVFYQFGTQFGLRARDEARQLQFGDIELKSMPNVLGAEVPRKNLGPTMISPYRVNNL